MTTSLRVAEVARRSGFTPATLRYYEEIGDMWWNDPLPEFYRVASDILRWAPQIFNYHRAGRRWSNGRLEGTNNLLGLLKRMGFGFVNASNFEARGILLVQPSTP